MGNANVSHRVETLAVSSAMDMERAMASTTLPKRIDLQANLLTHAKGATVERLLRRVGCHELCIQGKSSSTAAPRRLFEPEVVRAIGHVKQSRLQKLILKNLDIQRGDNDHHSGPNRSVDPLECMAHRLSKLTHLEELHLQSCRIDESILEDILISIKQLPHLKQVTINLRDHITNRRLRAQLEHVASELVARPQMTSMALSEYPLQSCFWKNVAVSDSLTHLSLALRHDDQLSLLHPHQRQYFWDLLQQNKSIQQLEFQVAAGVSLTNLQEMLADNSTVTSLLLHLEEDPTHVSQWLSQVLEYDNFTLEKVHLLCHNLYGYKVRIPNRQIDFYTRLNRNGRRKLVGDDANSTRSQEWVTALSQNTYDVSSTYYWLQAHPQLVTRAIVAATTTTDN
ncbi:expressed unknown protein [Seminavis robusta]|uniref:Uncharacterized protein n=1 Tax=Seminavis robusta TaxID=568900 RepID=A0A9N8E3D7_9STRA|nr:expressed unknown protein [Seminavis robusta]|eukprot:Sro618_g176280.1 n/a (396) ;mRNA; r:34678-35865